MAIGKVKKQSWEAFYIAGSILPWQEDDTTETVVLNSSMVLAEDRDGNDVSLTFIEQGTKVLGTDPDGDFISNMLAIRLKGDGGVEADSPFKVTFRMVTDEGNQFEVDIMVYVREI